jgi:hypothetical protein
MGCLQSEKEGLKVEMMMLFLELLSGISQLEVCGAEE